jgi:hypothetical protein
MSLDFVSWSGTIGIEYENFLYSRNLHNVSARGAFGYGIGSNDFGLGLEMTYGFGNIHRVEFGLGGYHLIANYSQNFIDVEENVRLVNLFFRTGYAYFAKENPMYYRVGFMPTFSVAYGRGVSNSWYINGFYLGVGYRF